MEQLAHAHLASPSAALVQPEPLADLTRADLTRALRSAVAAAPLCSALLCSALGLGPGAGSPLSGTLHFLWSGPCGVVCVCVCVCVCESVCECVCVCVCVCV